MTEFSQTVYPKSLSTKLFTIYFAQFCTVLLIPELKRIYSHFSQIFAQQLAKLFSSQSSQYVHVARMQNYSIITAVFDELETCETIKPEIIIGSWKMLLLSIGNI